MFQRKQKPLYQNIGVLNDFIEELNGFKTTDNQNYISQLIDLIKTYRDASDNFTKHSENLLKKINEGISPYAKAPIFIRMETEFDSFLRSYLGKLQKPEDSIKLDELPARKSGLN